MSNFSSMQFKGSRPKNHTFDRDTYLSLLCREDFVSMWNDVGLAELPESEREGLNLLISGSWMDTEPDFDPTKVLLVRATNGVVESVYGPGIFRDGNKIVLKVNANTIKVTQEGDKLVVGTLKGRINLRLEKDASEREYPAADCAFRAESGVLLTVRLSLNTEDPLVSYESLQGAIINEDSLLPYLLQVPTPAIPMYQLGVGEYGVTAISRVPEGKFGEGFKLHLSNGVTVWAKGNAFLQCAGGLTVSPDHPVTLRIVRVEKLSETKYAIDNQLVLRYPRTEDGRNLLDVAAVPVPEIKPDPEESVAANENYDEIPF